MKSFDYNVFFEERLSCLKDEGRYRYFANIERKIGMMPHAMWHKPDGSTQKVVVWCTNDYLGMSQNSRVLDAAIEACNSYGVGSGGTRNIAGTSHLHVSLEKEIAKWHGKEQGLIFTSGYVANEATLCTLGRELKNCIIYSDEKNHASMIRGIQQSGAEKFVFSHHDLKPLKKHLAEADPARPKIIAFVSVYSMDGDIAPMEDLCELAENHNALLYVDEVHAVGLYGNNGAGVAAHLGLADQMDVIQANFAKAFGIIGGYITGSYELADFVRSYAPGFIFTTSLPPVITASALEALDVLRHATDLRDKFWANVSVLKSTLLDAGLPVIDGDSHISPILVGDPRLCREISDYLLTQFHCYVQPINFPTVPRGTERLRVTITPSHTHAMIEEFVTALRETWGVFGLKLAA